MSLLTYSFNSHEVQLARFELSLIEDHLKLEIFVEKEDLNFSFNRFELLEANEKEAVLNDYIATYINWYINDQQYDICSFDYSADLYHLRLEGYFGPFKKDIQRIQISNRFLIEEIPEHLNIIHVNLNQKLRSFRMDTERQYISIEY